MADKIVVDKAEDKAKTVVVPAVGETLTAEGLAAMRAELLKELSKDSEAAVFSIPGHAATLNVGLHEQLMASIPTDLKGKDVPEGCVAMYCASDVRAVLNDGSTFLFKAKAVKFVPARLEQELAKFGCAVFVAPSKA